MDKFYTREELRKKYKGKTVKVSNINYEKLINGEWVNVYEVRGIVEGNATAEAGIRWIEVDQAE